MLCKKCRKEIPDGSIYCNHCGRKQTVDARRVHRGNGQGTAVKRGRTWSAVWSESIGIDENGKLMIRRRWKGGFATKAEALIYAASPKQDAPRSPTLLAYYNAWLDSDYKDLSHSKQQAYEIAWRKWKDLQNIPVSDLTIQHLQVCLDEHAETYYPARDMRTILSHLYKRAVAEGHARTNLAEFIRIPPLNEKESTPFDEADLRKFWKAYASGDLDQRYILLMIYTGMMPGELLSLSTAHIDVKKREILGAGLKTKKRKMTPIVYPPLIDAVVADIIDGASDGAVVTDTKHQFYTRYYEAVERAGAQKLPPYSCRHTTATALALGNIAPSVIQEVMRHTKFATTQRYIHPDTSAAHAAIDTLGAAVEESTV